MGGMVNTCELLLNVVTSGKPKMLRGLGQNGTVAGTGSCFYPVMDTQRYRRIESTSPVRSTLWNVVSPYRSFGKEGRKVARPTQGDAGRGVGKSEGRPVTGRIRVATSPGAQAS